MVMEIPANWKPAGSGEEELDWVLYDTEGGYNAADVVIQYFDQGESAVGRDETNMAKANELPANQRFLIKEIYFFVNDVSASADEHVILDRSVMEILINNKRMFVAPLRMLVGAATILPSGVTQDEDHMVGQGYKLDKGLVINGGDNIAVEVETSQTAAGADTECTIAFRGRLVRPGG